MGIHRGTSPSRSLLLCITNPVDRQALRGMLAREGYCVDAVCHGAEAVQLVRQQRKRCNSLWRIRSLLTSRTATAAGAVARDVSERKRAEPLRYTDDEWNFRLRNGLWNWHTPPQADRRQSWLVTWRRRRHKWRVAK